MKLTKPTPGLQPRSQRARWSLWTFTCGLIAWACGTTGALSKPNGNTVRVVALLAWITLACAPIWSYAQACKALNYPKPLPACKPLNAATLKALPSAPSWKTSLSNLAGVAHG